MCSGFRLCPQGPAQCRNPGSFGIRSPRLTVPEVLTHPSAKRSQPPLLKACSWTNLQRQPRSCSHANLEQTGSWKTTEKLVSLSQVEPRTSNLCFPCAFASTGSQAHPTSHHFLCTCLPALPSSAGSKGLLDLCPAFMEANWLLLPWSELKRTSFRGEGAECREPAEATSISPLSPNV